MGCCCWSFDGVVQAADSGVIADMVSVQARRTTDYNNTTSFADVTFDTTDVENNTEVLEHDNTNTDRLIAKETGLYLIGYHFDAEFDNDGTHEWRVRKNDTTVLDGSETLGSDSYDVVHHGVTFIVSLMANDYISLQGKTTSNAVTLADITFHATRLKGTKGATGSTGAAGAGNDIEVQDEGTPLTTAVTEFNFAGAGVTVTEPVADEVLVTIPGGGASTFGSEFENSSSEGVSSTTSTSYQEKLTLSTASLPSGVYRIGWSYSIQGGGDTESRVQLNDTTTLMDHSIDDSTQRYNGTGGFYVTGTISGVQDIDIDYRSSGGTAYIKLARLEIWRIS